MNKPIEIRDLSIFSFIILLGLAIFAVTVYLVLSNVTSLLFQLGLYDSAVYIQYASLSVIVVSIVMMVLYYFIIGTILKRLNKANKWKQENVKSNTSS